MIRSAPLGRSSVQPQAALRKIESPLQTTFVHFKGFNLHQGLSPLDVVQPLQAYCVTVINVTNLLLSKQFLLPICLNQLVDFLKITRASRRMDLFAAGARLAIRLSLWISFFRKQRVGICLDLFRWSSLVTMFKREQIFVVRIELSKRMMFSRG